MPESRSDKLYKWTLLGLLAFTYFLMHASRQVFNASLPQIQGDPRFEILSDPYRWTFDSNGNLFD